MGFLKLIWGAGRPVETPTVSQEEFEQVTREYDRQLDALDEAIHALRDHEPDERTSPNAP